LDGYTEEIYSATTNLVQVVRHKASSSFKRNQKKIPSYATAGRTGSRRQKGDASKY
jgi:hypothetical protein